MDKLLPLSLCPILVMIGILFGFTFWGQLSNDIIPPQPDNDTEVIVVDNNETVIVDNRTEIENNTEIVDEEFIHNFSKYTLLK